MKEGCYGLLGDLPFFFCPDSQDLDRGVVFLDFQDLCARFSVLLLIHRDSEPFEPLAE